MVLPVGGSAAMTNRKPVEPAPGPLEDYAARFDDLFANPAPNVKNSGVTSKACCWPRSATRL
jgi:hypothetical protein